MHVILNSLGFHADQVASLRMLIHYVFRKFERLPRSVTHQLSATDWKLPHQEIRPVAGHKNLNSKNTQSS